MSEGEILKKANLFLLVVFLYCTPTYAAKYIVSSTGCAVDTSGTNDFYVCGTKSFDVGSTCTGDLSESGTKREYKKRHRLHRIDIGEQLILDGKIYNCVSGNKFELSTETKVDAIEYSKEECVVDTKLANKFYLCGVSMLTKGDKCPDASNVTKLKEYKPMLHSHSKLTVGSSINIAEKNYECTDKGFVEGDKIESIEHSREQCIADKDGKNTFYLCTLSMINAGDKCYEVENGKLKTYKKNLHRINAVPKDTEVDIDGTPYKCTDAGFKSNVTAQKRVVWASDYSCAVDKHGTNIFYVCGNGRKLETNDTCAGENFKKRHDQYIAKNDELVTIHNKNYRCCVDSKTDTGVFYDNDSTKVCNSTEYTSPKEDDTDTSEADNNETIAEEHETDVEPDTTQIIEKQEITKSALYKCWRCRNSDFKDCVLNGKDC